MKTNAVVLIICLALYLAVMAYIIWRLVDIGRNLKKYEERDLQERAERLERTGIRVRFFKSLGHQYSFLTFLIAAALTGLTFLLGFGCIRLIAGGRQTVTVGNSLIGATLSLFVNLILGMVIIPLHIKTDVCAVALNAAFNCKGRAEIAKLGYTLLAVFFALSFPFMALSCNTYICYDETGVYSSQFFQLEEVYTSYGEVRNVKICISHDSYGNTGDFEYILTLCNGESLNVNKPNMGCKRFEKSTFQIHKYLEEKAGCAVEVVEPTAEDLYYINNKLSAERREIALYILEGFHR